MFRSYLDAVDPNFSYALALVLSEDARYHSSPIGSRTAGSDAEHAAADFLVAKMLEIGLVEVEKVAVNVDKWEFNGATLVLDGESTAMQLHSYATVGTPLAGIGAEIVYVGNGTMWNYTTADVRGKIVMCEINQQDWWWVDWPSIEAFMQGAVAALVVQAAGFSEVDDTALNQNDFGGPAWLPTASLSLRDARRIKDLLSQGPVTGVLRIANTVEAGGVTYNVVGRIPGRNREEMILFGAHYDMYFHGFQDDSIGIGHMMGIAKALVASHYVPERDLVFVAHGAEEWGAIYTEYDWAVGAWRMIDEARPEWAGKTLAFINFELSAYEFADYTSSDSAPELFGLLDRFVNEVGSPKPRGVFSEGIRTMGHQTFTYSDDFPFYVGGVPSIVNSFLMQEDREDVFPFYRQYYHTPFDTKELYDERVSRFSLEFYGALGIYIDQTPALELDYGWQHARVTAALDEDLARECGIDVADYRKVVKRYGEEADRFTGRISEMNGKYAKLVASGASASKLDGVRAEARRLNAKTLSLFQQTQDVLVGLLLLDPIVPHEAPQWNIELIDEIVECLEEGAVDLAVDELVPWVNGGDELNNMYFSRSAMGVFDAMRDDEANKRNLIWAGGREFMPALVENATRSLMVRRADVGGDFSGELEIYRSARAAQVEEYRRLVAKEVEGIRQLTAQMKEGGIQVGVLVGAIVGGVAAVAVVVAVVVLLCRRQHKVAEVSQEAENAAGGDPGDVKG